MARLSLPNWYLISTLIDAMESSKATDLKVAEALGVVPATIANWKKGAGQPSVGDVREFITQFGGGNEEEILYAQKVVRAKKADMRDFEFDSRFSAILLAKGERHYNRYFVWEPDTIPGPFQSEAFQFKILQHVEGTTDKVAQFGWDFKRLRAGVLRSRIAPFYGQFLMGEAALLWLREFEAGDRRDQIDLLREWNSLAGIDIRIMSGPHTFRSPFVLLQPAGSPTAGPGFVVLETLERTWCLAEPTRVELYHERTDPNWRRATPLEEFLDAKRDRLA